MISLSSMRSTKNIKMKGTLISVLAVTALISSISALTLVSVHLQPDGTGT